MQQQAVIFFSLLWYACCLRNLKLEALGIHKHKSCVVCKCGRVKFMTCKCIECWAKTMLNQLCPGLPVPFILVVLFLLIELAEGQILPKFHYIPNFLVVDRNEMITSS